MAIFVCMYLAGIWLVGRNGTPLYFNFMNLWAPAGEALQEKAAEIYEPAAHLQA